MKHRLTRRAPRTANTGHAEYSELWNNLRHGVTTLWEAFKTYFTVEGLLFAGAGFLLSSELPFEPSVAMTAALVVAIGGAVITILGAFGIQRILTYQKAFIKRGREIEGESGGAQLFEVANRVWEEKTFSNAQLLTYLVFFLFGSAWVVLALYCACSLIG